MGAASGVRTGSRDPTTSDDYETVDGGSETDGGRDEVALLLTNNVISTELSGRLSAPTLVRRPTRRSWCGGASLPGLDGLRESQTPGLHGAPGAAERPLRAE